MDEAISNLFFAKDCKHVHSARGADSFKMPRPLHILWDAGETGGRSCAGAQIATKCWDLCLCDGVRVKQGREKLRAPSSAGRQKIGRWETKAYLELSKWWDLMKQNLYADNNGEGQGSEWSQVWLRQASGWKLTWHLPLWQLCVEPWLNSVWVVLSDINDMPLPADVTLWASVTLFSALLLFILLSLSSPFF